MSSYDRAVPIWRRLVLAAALTALFLIAGGWYGLIAAVPLWLLVLVGILLDG